MPSSPTAMRHTTHAQPTNQDKVVFTHQTTPLGELVLAANTQALVGCWFDKQSHFPNLCDWQRDDQHPLLRRAQQQLQAFFNGRLQTFDLPLHPLWGSPFQQQVWRALQTIAYGETATYAEIARAIGRPSAARAVGAAVGRNPLSVIVPCHRVLGSNGALTGYAGGLQRKQCLLLLESQHA